MTPLSHVQEAAASSQQRRRSRSRSRSRQRDARIEVNDAEQTFSKTWKDKYVAMWEGKPYLWELKKMWRKDGIVHEKWQWSEIPIQGLGTFDDRARPS